MKFPSPLLSLLNFLKIQTKVRDIYPHSPYLIFKHLNKVKAVTIPLQSRLLTSPYLIFKTSKQDK